MTRQSWHNGAQTKFVFFPGDNVKPINAGTVDRARFIANACNTHADLVDTLQHALDTIDACGSINMDEARALVDRARKVGA